MFNQSVRGASVLKRAGDLSQVLVDTSACLKTVGLQSIGLLIISGNATILAGQLAAAAAALADEDKPAPDSVAVTLPDGLDLSAFADLILDHNLETAQRNSGKRPFGAYESYLVLKNSAATRQQLAIAMEKCAEHFISEAEKLAAAGQIAVRSKADRKRVLSAADSTTHTSFVSADSDPVRNPGGHFQRIFTGNKNW